MSEVLTLSLMLSPATLWRKLISASCILYLILFGHHPQHSKIQGVVVTFFATLPFNFYVLQL